MTEPTTGNGNGKGNGNERNVYETTTSLVQYLNLHYPSSVSTGTTDASNNARSLPPIVPHDNAPVHALRFPQRVAELLNKLVTKYNLNNNPKASSTTIAALDAGCAVGGSSFELATVFDHVDAFDYSTQFITAANQMKNIAMGESSKSLSFDVPIEGDIVERMMAVPEPTTTADIASRVNFFVGDACKMKDMVKYNDASKISINSQKDDSRVLRKHGYDGVLLSNLLCRLPDPMICLESLPDLVRPPDLNENGTGAGGGIVLILTPYTWMTEYTPREHWLGGYYDTNSTTATNQAHKKRKTENNDDDEVKNNEGDTDGESENGSQKRSSPRIIWSKDTLQSVMERMGFEKIHEEQVPMLIREHQRKYQYCISEATGWKKI